MARRSWLFVPGGSESKLEKAAGAGADVVVIDLEDSVPPESKPNARMLAREWLIAHRLQVLNSHRIARWVRINGLDTPFWREDLAAVMGTQPEGILLPKAAGTEQLQALSAEIYEQEQRSGLPTNSTRIVPMVGATAAAALTIPAYVEATLPRLAGLTWVAEDLSAAIGATRQRDEAGCWTDVFSKVRADVLLTANARGVLAIDTHHAKFKDIESLELVAKGAAADGFDGMLAVHPSQIPVINAAFTPSPEKLAEARAIIDTFAANPGVVAVSFAGRMIDQPHLAQAKRLLAMDA
jgi:citrate lyase subunit beta/citryl-CoA lyase